MDCNICNIFYQRIVAGDNNIEGILPWGRLPFGSVKDDICLPGHYIDDIDRIIP